MTSHFPWIFNEKKCHKHNGKIKAVSVLWIKLPSGEASISSGISKEGWNDMGGGGGALGISVKFVGVSWVSYGSL